MPRADKLVAERPLTEKPALATTEGDAEAAGQVEETPLEALASICSVLVIGLFVLTFIAQNYLIPSGSMEKTLLVGDHLLVDRITIAPSSKWMPLVHYREPKRGDVVVFFGPGQPDTYLVKRCIGTPGDRIHLRNGQVFVNGVAQTEPYVNYAPDDRYRFDNYVDNFPSVAPSESAQGPVTSEWTVDLPNHIQGEDLVVPPNMFFMMGDHRHASNDGRYWGFVPRENIAGRPLFNYWSFKTPDDQIDKTSFSDQIGWLFHVVTRFFQDTRWSRTFHVIR